MTEHSEYLEYAKAAAKIIKQNGYEVQLYKNVCVLSVKIKSRIFYVHSIPKIKDYAAKYGSNCKLTYVITQQFIINYTTDVIVLAERVVNIFGKYYLYNISYTGYLYDNKYVRYMNVWVERFHNPKISANPPTVLDNDFNTVNGVDIIIKNSGYKVIEHQDIYKKLKSLTIFHYPFYITAGKYIKSGCDDLFRFINKEGELVSLLTDAQTGERTLNSESKIIKLDKLDDYEVKEKDGLYNGYIIDSKWSRLNKKVYCYNYTFIVRIDWSYYLEIEARSSVGGTKTKPAAAKTD
jgi:hypothetical protein